MVEAGYLQTCVGCGLLLRGPAAEELWWVDSRMWELEQRREELLHALAPGGEALPQYSANEIRPQSGGVQPGGGMSSAGLICSSGPSFLGPGC